MPEEVPLQDRVRAHVMRIYSPIRTRERGELLRELAGWYHAAPKHDAWMGTDDALKSVVSEISRPDALTITPGVLHQRFRDSAARDLSGLTRRWKKARDMGKGSQKPTRKYQRKNRQF